MSSVDKAIATQLANIEKRTGKTLDQLTAIVKKSGLEKHGELVAMLKNELSMGHGDANTLVHHVKGNIATVEEKIASGDPLDEIYVGAKAGLRPIHEKLMKAIEKFGEFEIAPKKGYVSLRRKKQFAMIGPATNTRIDVGINMKGVAATARLEAQPEKSMCQYKVKVTRDAEVDKELVAWVKMAYEGAG
jgi:t-SNARE complex subunit (syntaxin)